MADNLESYFKKHLSDENPAAENWNVPSEDVWNKVLPEIQKKRGLFIPWKYFYFLGIVLVAVLAFLLWPSGEGDFDPQKDSLTIVDETEQSSINQISETKDSETLTSEDYKNTTNSADNSKNQFSINPDETLNQTNLENTQSNNQLAEINSTNKNIPNQTGSETDQTGFGKNTFEGNLSGNEKAKNINALFTGFSSSDQEQNNQISKLSGKSIESISLTGTVAPLEQTAFTSTVEPEKITSKKEPFDNKGKFAIGAYYAPTFTSTYLSGELSSGFLKTGNQYLYSGNWGFEINYFLSNRLTLVTGIGRSEIRSSSTSLIEFPYSTANENAMPSGDKENTSLVPMQTPFGEINTEITFLVPGNVQFPDGEPMQSEMQTEQELRYLSIPLGVEFNVIRFSRFSWFVDAGLQYNRALKDATQFHSRILHEGDDMEVMYEQMTSHPAYTENYLSFYAGTGMNYQFSKSFQLKASANYFGNITKVNIQDNLSTYVNGISLKFGLVYIF